MTDRHITEIPLDELHDSPFNPPNRATLAIDDLAASIKAEGRVHSPLLVRPRSAGGFEIVYGHRRRHAAEAAGLATVPCEVRAMTDAEARSAQAAENVQRENLKALEEAEAYQAMIDGDNLTADDVAKAIGKSRSHVYGRLRLLSLGHQVREALKSGEVQGEVALLIARVGDEKMQAKALTAIRNIGADLEDGGKKSYRRIRELLNEKLGPNVAEARNATVLGLNDVDKQTDLISRLQDEADLCRNDGASDIAALLDEAVAALQAPRPEVAGDGSEAMQLSWVPLNRRNLDWHAHATVQLRAMHVALSAAQKTPRDPLEIEELWDEAHELLEQGEEHGPEVHELFARLIERAHGIGV